MRGIDAEQENSCCYYCFINVGRAAGKIKFCMLDKENDYIGEKYDLRAVLVRDTHSEEAAVHVLAFPNMSTDSDDRRQVKTVQQIIWELYDPKHSPTHTVVHINGNTMDNRITNLTLVQTPTLPSLSRNTINSNEKTTSDIIYSECALQLVPLTNWVNVPESLKHIAALPDYPLPQGASLDEYAKRLLDESTNGMPTYHECHYLPCTNIERRQFQYDSCGGCGSVRYCSSDCQFRDWMIHKEHCQLLQHLDIQSQLSASPHAKNEFSIAPSSDFCVQVER